MGRLDLPATNYPTAVLFTFDFTGPVAPFAPFLELSAAPMPDRSTQNSMDVTSPFISNPGDQTMKSE